MTFKPHRIAALMAAASLFAALPVTTSGRPAPAGQVADVIPRAPRGSVRSARCAPSLMVDGTGAPAQGPFDIVIENDRIAQIKSIGAPGADRSRRARRTRRP